MNNGRIGALLRLTPALGVGSEVPEILFEDDEGALLSLRALAGRPVVIAFSPRWNAGNAPGVDEAIRAELRGLGAVLLVIAGSAVFLHQADDPVTRYRLAHASGARIEAAHHAFGIASSAVALFLVDGKCKIRFRRDGGGESGDEARVVLTALSAAGEAMRAPPPGRVLTLNRREMVVATLVAAFSLFALDACEPPAAQPGPAAPPQPQPPAPTPAPATGDGTVAVRLDVNGEARALQIEPRVTLLDALREQLALTGTKKGCDHGQCGACTVLVDGRRINACMTFAIMHQGQKITTIEGLSRGAELHPMQAAFIEHDAFQCGYCTPGQIMSAIGMQAEGGAKTPAEIREKMSGNICRCGAYSNIVAAITQAAGKA